VFRHRGSREVEIAEGFRMVKPCAPSACLAQKSLEFWLMCASATLLRIFFDSLAVVMITCWVCYICVIDVWIMARGCCA
jgi:hypothetical protein